jgi:glycosyltransferase involved in cell wall biosynthesis
MVEDRLRIAVFSDSAFPILNGVSVSVDALISELRDQGHSVHLYAPRFPGYHDADPNVIRFPSVELPFWRGYPLSVPPFYNSLRKFRRYRYDIVHTHTPFLLGMVALRWAESHGLPIVSTYHTLYDRYSHYVMALPRRYVRYRIARHTNFYFNRVDHVITPTRTSAKWLLRHAVHKPVSIVPTGSPKPPILDRAEIRHSLGLAPEHRMVLYVGRLAEEKNLDTLLEAMPPVMADNPHLRLWLVGDGPYTGACRHLVRRLGIGDRVRFAGFVPRAEVDRYYAAADLFAFASISETQGLVIQEAMRFGLPAVAVVGGGASETVEHGVNGWLCRNHPSDLAAGIRHVMRNPELYDQLSQGAQVTARAHGIRAMGEKILETYREVLRRRTGREVGSDVVPLG